MSTLVDLATELARSPLAWSHLVQEGESQRWYARIAATDEFDAWLLGWPPGCGVPLHDHGGVTGVCCVVEGRLVETVASQSAASPLQVSVLGRGAVASFDADHVHAMTNLDDHLALSIHVYSPVLQTMQFFRAEAGELVASHQEVVHEEVYAR